MYLSDLEIFGFKSFGKKTKLKFTDGLTCVVGPNGCGKTNIVDGIRWVLGEQRSSVMRSEVMENVIFNGNAKRKPLGMAEVVMTIQNNKNILPTEYSEVEITRRLFRDGNSQYLINGTRCRLKDIHDLFMDTGMGANSYSVIELKMVEAILSGKPEERRQLLEEAAGVVRYKTRRKEASRKLSNVQQDLERLTDIESEVGKQVNSLQRQAAKTRRYNEYVTELRSIELEVMARDYAAYQEKAKAIAGELEQLRKDANKFEFTVTDKENSLAKLKANLQAAQVKLAETRGKRETILAEIADAEKRLAVATEKSSSVERNTDRIKGEMDNSSNIRANAEKSLEAAKDRFERYSADIKEMEEHTAEAREAESKAKRELEEARSKANRLAGELGSLQSSLQSTKSMIGRLENRINEITSRVASSGQQIEAFDTSAFELSQKQQELEKQLEEARKLAEAKSKELETQGKARDEIKAKIDEKNSELSGLKSDLNNVRSTLRFYESLVDHDSVSEYLRKTSWKQGKVQQVAELIGVDEEYKKAVGSMISDIAGYFIVDSADEAQKGISQLKNSKKGKASFLVKGKGSGNKAKDIAGGRAVLSLIRYPKELAGYLEERYANSYIVENDEQAESLVAKHEDIEAVTKEGTIYTSLGRIRGGSELESEGMMLGKQEKIDAASAEIENLEHKIGESSAKLAELTEKRNAINLEQIRGELNNAERQGRQLDNELSQVKVKKDSLGGRIEVLKESIEKNEQEKKETEKELGGLSESITELEKGIKDKEGLLNTAKADTEAKSQALSKAQTELREKELEHVRLRGEIDQAEKDKRRLERSLNDMAIRIRTGKDEIEELAQKAIEYAKEIEYSRSAIEEKKDELSEAENELRLTREEENDLSGTVRQEESELRNSRKEAEMVKETLHKKDLEANEVQLRINNLAERAQENHETDIATVKPGEETENVEESRARVAELKQKLQNIGPVNFAALEEYEETKERHTFMVSQIADLTESEKNLQKTIEEINETAEKIFLETFEKIRDNFRTLFNSLFDGDAEADLKLVGENPLESDIHITAKPPGKKPHSIEMLSGGEKTLTAISLLFAIYMVKPSPFCILDEVDAPLDDANIGRFVSLLRRFSEQTQFLIVTHNKKTMEAADNLYGVTQQEMGLSQVVSVKIDGKKSAA